MLTITQNSSYYLLSAKTPSRTAAGEQNASLEKKEDSFKNRNEGSSGSVSADSSGTSSGVNKAQIEKMTAEIVAEVRAKQNNIEYPPESIFAAINSIRNADTPEKRAQAEIEYWQTPLTDYQREELRALSKTLDINANLEISATRPAYPEHRNSDYQHTAVGINYLPGRGKKLDEIQMLRQGNALDHKIQQLYQELSQALDIEERELQQGGAETGQLVKFALTDINALEESVPGSLEYVREVIFQRSKVETGKAIDIGKLMQQHDLISDKEFTALPHLSMPQDSEKLQAFADKVAADELAAEEKLAAAQKTHEPTRLPENSIFMTAGEVADNADASSKFTKYIVKAANNAYAKFDLNTVMEEVWQDSQAHALCVDTA